MPPARYSQMTRTPATAEGHERTGDADATGKMVAALAISGMPASLAFPPRTGMTTLVGGGIRMTIVPFGGRFKDDGPAGKSMISMLAAASSNHHAVEIGSERSTRPVAAIPSIWAWKAARAVIGTAIAHVVADRALGRSSG